MSNLATMIMEGSSYGFGGGQLSHSYDHEDGATLIAMESAEALRNIFEAEFYVPNTCTISAALEGASSVTESSQVSVMEASVKGVFKSIADFFIKLKNKVVDFLHNIKRNLLGMFGNQEKWLTKYSDDVKALSDDDLKGYKYKMFEYNEIKVDTIDINATAENLKSICKNYLTKAYGDTVGNKSLSEDDIDNELNDKYGAYLKKLVGNSDPDEFNRSVWSFYRNNAYTKDSKTDIAIDKKKIESFMKAINDSSSVISTIDKLANQTNSVYNGAVSFVKECEANVAKAYKSSDSNNITKIDRDKAGINSNPNADKSVNMGSTAVASYTMVLRKYSAYMSKCQNASNTMLSGAKQAISERNSEYMKVITGAFAYAKKNKKKGGK